jgi:hypothetical protein
LFWPNENFIFFKKNQAHYLAQSFSPFQSMISAKLELSPIKFQLAQNTVTQLEFVPIN